MWFFIIIAVLILFFVIYAVVLVPENEKERKLKNDSIKEYICENGIVSSSEYTYENQFYQTDVNFNESIFFKFIVDDKNRKVHIIGAHGTECIPFDEIIDCEVQSDSKTVGGVKRAVVGALIAGETGAIVGAVSAKPHIMSYKIVIYRNNTQSPTTELPLITQKTSTKNKDFVSAEEFAQKVFASIKVIIYQNEHRDEQEPVQQTSTNGNYDVVFATPIGDKIKAVKYIHEVTQMGLAEAKHYVDNPNAVVYSAVSIGFANDVVSTLKKQGVYAMVVDKTVSDETTAQSTNAVADEIEKLYQLKEKGIITEDEFNQQKMKLLGI